MWLVAEVPPGGPSNFGMMLQRAYEDVIESSGKVTPVVQSERDGMPVYVRVANDGSCVLAVEADDPDMGKGLLAQAILRAAIPGISLAGGMALTVTKGD